MFSHQKIIGKIIFRDQKSQSSYQIIGEIDKDQIYSQDCHWITVELSNKFLLNNNLRNSTTAVHKADITKIIIYRPIRHFTFDKSSLGLNEILKTNKESAST